MIPKMQRLILLLTAAATLIAQAGRPQASEEMRQAIHLDLYRDYTAACSLLQKEIDSATAPLIKASTQRAMAMSYAFERNCIKTAEYEQQVITYCATRENEEPQKTFYQQGEMANEAARVCIDSGDSNAAEKWYVKGTELGLKEHNISADRRTLWQYRLEHAKARIAVRLNNKGLAEKHSASARIALDKMTDLKKAQELYFPYLTGAGSHSQTSRKPIRATPLSSALKPTPSNNSAVKENLSTARGHNPPAAYAVPLARKKLA